MKQRVMLHAATIDDVEFIVDVKTNASLWKYEDDISSDRDAVRKSVVDRIDSDWYKQYLIKLDDESNTIIGTFHMHWYVKERESWELGYSIFPEYRGHGYSFEAGKIALGYVFDDWGAHKVVGMCNEHNIASSKVMEKLGMTREGVFREEIPWQDKWVNQYFYCILDSEYSKLK